MNVQNNKGQTPLHFAFSFGYQELGQCVVQPSQRARWKRRNAGGRYLIAKAGADPTIKNHFGLTCYEGLGFKSGPN
jgi:ankyrin repeat protein